MNIALSVSMSTLLFCYFKHVRGGQRKCLKDVLNANMKKCNIDTNSWETIALDHPRWRKCLWQGSQHFETQRRQQEEEKRVWWKDHAAARTNNPGPPVPSNNPCPNCHRVCGSCIGLISHLQIHRPLHGWQSYSTPRDWWQCRQLLFCSSYM